MQATDKGGRVGTGLIQSNKPSEFFLFGCEPRAWPRMLKCTIKIFFGGRGGGWGGDSSERCLKWGGGGSLRDLSKNILKQGVGKGKSCS